MEFLPIMINRAGVLIASEVIRGIPELSCNPVSSHFLLPFPLFSCSWSFCVIDPSGQGRLFFRSLRRFRTVVTPLAPLARPQRCWVSL